MELFGTMYLKYVSTQQGSTEITISRIESTVQEIPLRLKNDGKGLFVSFRFDYPGYPVKEAIQYYINGPFDGDELIPASGKDIYSMNTHQFLFRDNELLVTGGFNVFEWDKEKVDSWRFLMVFDDEKLREHLTIENVEWVF